MQRETQRGFDAEGEPVDVLVLIPESDEDVRELARMARRGELDDRHSFADHAKPADRRRRSKGGRPGGRD